MDMIKIAIMGHGVVGSGVVEVLEKNKESIKAKIADDYSIEYILDLRDFSDSPYSDKFTKDFTDIERDDSIDIVVETMGGITPALDYTRKLLSKGISVVTSNKELVACHGAELMRLAKENNANYLFEASVGGGIPIIRPISQCLAANEIDEIVGILNGTTNFILTKMIKDQMSFTDALKLAQELGYAERDPTDDVEGHDACRKICILISLAFGYHCYPDNVRTEGISNITLEDVEYAEKWGGVIKLIARGKRMPDGKVHALVCPAFIPDSSQLSSVDDVFNGILVRGDVIGDVVFYGRGAGKLPTASAVVADIIDAANHLKERKPIFWQDTKEDYLLPSSGYEHLYYLRIRPGKLAQKEIAELVGAEKILLRDNVLNGEFAVITGLKKEAEIEEIINKSTSQGYTVLNKIRIINV